MPSAENFPNYLLRLEQLLAVRCGAMEGVRSDFVNGEREIIEGNLQLCLAAPDSVSTRILLVQTMQAMKRIRPDILPEFKERMTMLQNEHRLNEAAQKVVQDMLSEVFHGP